MENKVKILIIGTGFGGTYVLKNLGKILPKDQNIELSIIGEKNYFIFSPLLHEVATGGINPQNIIEPIRKVMGHCLKNFYLGKAKEINQLDQTVLVDGQLVSYDYLVLAPGSTTNFYNIPGAQENCFTLKSIDDAIKIKNHLIIQMEKASHSTNKIDRQKMLRFVVIGGGPTGVELVAEIAEFIHETFSAYYPKDLIDDTSVILLERGDELVSTFHKRTRQKSLEILEKKGVKVMLNTEVKEISNPKITLKSGELVYTETPIWVAGVRPVEIPSSQKIDRSANGKILVNENLQLLNYKNIFALGDSASFEQDGKPLPALAQVAEKQAKAIAKNIKNLIRGKEPKAFRYHHQGNMLSVGRWMAVGELLGFTIIGGFMWWVWRTIYLSKLISFRKKIEVALDWTLDLFSPRDISQI